MQGTRLPHRLAAVWFADVVGYSVRTAEDESGALQLIEILQALSRETVGRYDGRIVKFIGDAVLAESPSTALAVQAAPGQVVVSQDVWRQLRGRREFCFEPLGDRSLKGVGPIGLYVVTVQDSGMKSPESIPLRNKSEEETKKGIRSLGV